MYPPDPAWVALSLLKHVGIKTLIALLRHFEFDAYLALAAPESELRRVPGIGPKLAAAIRGINLEQVEAAIRRWQQAGVMIITPMHNEYPPRLRTLEDRPPVLFARGDWRPVLDMTVALVGTRSPTPESTEIALNLSVELSRRGWSVISGLAEGIDGAAHLGALAVPEGYTVAALGGGVLNVYPPSHRTLAEAVMKRGALLSEVHPQAAVNAASLVARNRIISGLADCVIVVETNIDGGAMYAARFARAQGRQVWALDLPASGNQALIASGALPIPRDLRLLDF